MSGTAQALDHESRPNRADLDVSSSAQRCNSALPLWLRGRQRRSSHPRERAARRGVRRSRRQQHADARRGFAADAERRTGMKGWRGMYGQHASSRAWVGRCPARVCELTHISRMATVSEPQTLTEKAVSLVKRVPTLVLQKGKVRDPRAVRRSPENPNLSAGAALPAPPRRAHPQSVITWRAQLCE